MNTRTGVELVNRERLRLSASPTSEIAAAALDAQNAAGLDQASFIVVAVDAERLAPARDAVTAALAEL